MDLKEKLKEMGLTGSESRVYLYLLEEGLASPPQIARGTGIARTNCYNILAQLKVDRLIEERQEGSRKAYLASDPAALLRSAERKKEVIEELLPDLRALHTTQKNKPQLRFYDGFEQVKEIYWQATETERLLALGSTKHLTDRDPKFFTSFERELKKNGVVLRDLITESSERVGLEETKQILKGLYDYRLLPKKYQDFPTDILVWGDNVALVTLEEPVFGTVITSPLLARTFEYMLEMIWEGRQ